MLDAAKAVKDGTITKAKVGELKEYLKEGRRAAEKLRENASSDERACDEPKRSAEDRPARDYSTYFHKIWSGFEAYNSLEYVLNFTGVHADYSENLEDASNQWVMRKSKTMHPVPVFFPRFIGIIHF